MLPIEFIDLATLGQPLQRVLSDRFEKPVASGGIRRSDDERLVDEVREKSRNLGDLHLWSSGNRLRGSKIETTPKHRETTEDDLPLGGEQPIAPVEGCSQGLLSGEGAPAADEELKRVVQTLGDLGWAERAHKRCRQLDGERDSVQPVAQLGDRGGILGGETKGWMARLGALDEEAHGFELGQQLEPVRGPRRWGGKGWDAPNDLTRQVEWFSTGSKDVKCSTDPNKLLDQRRAGRDQMLAVVQDEEQSFPEKKMDERFGCWVPRHVRRAKGSRDAVGDQSRVHQRRELDQPDAIRVFRQKHGGETVRQPCLATATGTGDRDQLVAEDNFLEVRNLDGAANKAGQLDGQIVPPNLYAVARGANHVRPHRVDRRRPYCT